MSAEIENNQNHDGEDYGDEWEPPMLEDEDFYLEPLEVPARPASFGPPLEISKAEWVTRSCSECNQDFRTRNDSDLCYGCTLSGLTLGMSPEEGDFNTAKIQSGTMTDEEWRLLQMDLWQAETGISLPEPEEIEAMDFLGWGDDMGEEPEEWEAK